MMVVPLTAEEHVRGVWVHDAPLYKGPHRAQHGSHTHLQQSHCVGRVARPRLCSNAVGLD